MKSFAICFVTLFAFAFARSVVDDYEYVNGGSEFNDRIVGGEETTIEKHPHQLSLRFSGNHICGGSIVAPNRALTAAHCIDQSDSASRYTIQVGSAQRYGDAKAQLRKLSKYVVHANHNKPRFANDVTILFWEEPLEFSATVHPIRIPALNAPVPYGENAVASGWGRIVHKGPLADVLKEVTKPLVSNKDCLKAYPRRVTEDMVCSGGEEGKGGCNGDSGGPLVHNDTLIGITSWTRLCAHKGYPTVYARVAFFIDWINENID